MFNFSQSPGTRYMLGALVVLAVFAGGVFVGFRRAPELGHAQTILNKEEGKPGDVDFALFWEVWDALDEKFVSPHSEKPLPTDQERVYAAIQGMVASFGDPYTVFMPPVEAEDFKADIAGEFSGIGCEIGKKDDLLTVISPLKGTPAYRADLRPGDVITKIDATETAGLTVDEAIRLIRGKKGTQVVLTIVRDKVEMEKKIIRDVIDIPTVTTEKLVKEKVFVISVYNFSAQSSSKFRSALGEFIASGYKNLVLDLRGNPGGYLEAAVDMASAFLPKDKLIVTEDFKGNAEAHVYNSKGYNLFSDNLDMVILVNGGSASASEILAGALSEYKVAKLVGTKTFGKGTVQELLETSPNTALKVTVARWLTPNGLNISDGGITPDVVVEVTEADIKAGRDPQLDKAVEILLAN